MEGNGAVTRVWISFRHYGLVLTVADDGQADPRYLEAYYTLRSKEYHHKERVACKYTFFVLFFKVLKIKISRSAQVDQSCFS